MNLRRIRDLAIKDIIKEEIEYFISGKRTRNCAYCSTKFRARSRFHFFHSKPCRKAFYAGVFKPSNKD